MKRKYRTRKRQRVRRMDPRVSIPAKYPWMVLSSLIDDLAGHLSATEVSVLRYIVRMRDVDLYRELAETWAPQSMCPSGSSAYEVSAKYQIACALKKYQFDTDKESRISKALEGFYAAEEACRNFNETGYKLFESDRTCMEILTYAREFLVRLLGPLPGHKQLLLTARHGPGASLDTKNGRCSSYDKYRNWPYSCSSGALAYAKFAIQTDRRWFGALQSSYRKRYGIPKHYPICMTTFWSRVLTVEDANRIDFVPKDALKERTIAIEPTMNIYLQLGVDGYIRRRLRRFGIDLNTQRKNQRLARIGSKELADESKQFVTLDMSAASDSVSLKICEMLLPSDWYSFLMALRCPYGKLNDDTLTYSKMSSMGNGYTFVLESALFAALVYAAMRLNGDKSYFANAAVYGDDIIVLRKHSDMTVLALYLAGFTLNMEKSFLEGPFRESCGADWFNGVPIRPVFLKVKPTSVQDIFLNHNRFQRILSLRYDLEQSKTSSLHLRWIPDKFKRYVGPYSNEDFDGYRHIPEPPLGSWSCSLYKYPRLVTLPRPQSGKNFLFRKLMHRLETVPIPKGEYPFEAAIGAGSRFTVTMRNRLRLSGTYSVASNWQSSYSEWLPRL